MEIVSYLRGKCSSGMVIDKTVACSLFIEPTKPLLGCRALNPARSYLEAEPQVNCLYHVNINGNAIVSTTGSVRIIQLRDCAAGAVTASR